MKRLLPFLLLTFAWLAPAWAAPCQLRHPPIGLSGGEFLWCGKPDASSTFYGKYTADGADNGLLQLGGSGTAIDAPRSAYLQLFGNEGSLFGVAHLGAGSGAVGQVILSTAGSARVTVESDGDVKLNVGHLLSSGTAPAVSSCGTSPSIDAASTDTAGRVTLGTGSPTSCTVTFTSAFPVAPSCMVTGDDPARGYAATTSTTALTITTDAAAPSDVVMFACVGPE